MNRKKRRKKVTRLNVCEGYDLWARTYDQTANPLVALDERYTVNLLQPKRGERILDAACGTGRNMGSRPTECNPEKFALTMWFCFGHTYVRSISYEISSGVCHMSTMENQAYELAENT